MLFFLRGTAPAVLSISTAAEMTENIDHGKKGNSERHENSFPVCLFAVTKATTQAGSNLR